MDPQAALTMGQNALFLLLMVAAPVLATVLGVGLVVSLFQAVSAFIKPLAPMIFITRFKL